MADRPQDTGNGALLKNSRLSGSCEIKGNRFRIAA
jgi:hypothetical protein